MAKMVYAIAHWQTGEFLMSVSSGSEPDTKRPVDKMTFSWQQSRDDDGNTMLLFDDEQTAESVRSFIVNSLSPEFDSDDYVVVELPSD